MLSTVSPLSKCFINDQVTVAVGTAVKQRDRSQIAWAPNLVQVPLGESLHLRPSVSPLKSGGAGNTYLIRLQRGISERMRIMHLARCSSQILQRDRTSKKYRYVLVCVQIAITKIPRAGWLQ